MSIIKKTTLTSINSIRIIAFVCIAVAWLISPRSAYACLWIESSTSEKTENADTVIEGIVWSTKFTGISELYPNDSERVIFNANYEAVIIVHRYIKGHGPQIVRLSEFGTLFDCGPLPNVAIGNSKLFFINDTGNELSVSRVLEASPKNISESISAVNQQPLPITPLPMIVLSIGVFLIRILQFFSPLLIIAYLVKMRPEKNRFYISIISLIILSIFIFANPFSIFLDFVTPTYILLLCILLLSIFWTRYKQMKSNI